MRTQKDKGTIAVGGREMVLSKNMQKLVAGSSTIRKLFEEGIELAKEVGAEKDKNAQLGLGAVLGYTFDNIYDFYATYKADASSILPSDKRWNSAWAVGIGWTPSYYPFLADNTVLTRLNLKASYGYTANLNGVSVSSTVATFAYSNNAYEDQRVLELMGLYNKDLKPEQTKSIDAGVSIELFNRVTLETSWYNRRTEQALLDVPIPSSTGYTTLKRNIGILENRGIEFGLKAKVLDTRDWILNLRWNMAYNRNKVIDLYYADKIWKFQEINRAGKERLYCHLSKLNTNKEDERI